MSNSASQLSASPPPNASSHRRVLTATTVGTTLEWFDFALYGALAGVVFPHVFFPTSTPAVAVIQSFATFGVGFLARPLGAAAFTRIADRAGRKKAMVVSLTMMGAVSLAIGLLPGYDSIGAAAPAGLVLLRFLQGFCLGGEASSAQVMALEYAPDNRRGIYGA
ncbi:MFS transporter, partial [Streptosporangium sp. NPDC001682]